MADKNEGADLSLALAAVSDARFHQLAYAIDDAVVVTDGAGHVLFANPAADRLLDSAPGELASRPFPLPLKHSKSGPCTLELADGRKRPLNLAVSATVWDGQIAYLAVLKPAIDPDASKAEAVETLLAAMRARFLAHVSHELRTPLNTVLGFSEAMAAELFGPLGDARYRGYAHDIHHAGERLLALLTDLLDLSRADSGDLALEESLFDLSELIDGLIPEALAVARGEAEQVTRGPMDPVLLRGDKSKIGRALVHLVANGLSFSEGETPVTVSTVRGDDGRVLIRIADSGRGFAPEELSNAFRPFPRVRTVERADPRTGPGVGLALVRRYIELHGGAVRIESEVGKGTVVTCMLPPERVALDLTLGRTTH
jgi:signal transduction histidine kinase